MRTLTIFSALAALAVAAGAAPAGDHAGSPDRCARCGCQTQCAPRVCQVVCEVKKEVKTCWQVECSEFCTLLPARHACGHDGSCDCQCGPRTGHPKTVKRLVKKEYVVEKPVYRGIVRYLCCQCAGTPDTAGSASPTPPSPPTPPVPPTPPTVPPTPPQPPQPTFAPKPR